MIHVLLNSPSGISIDHSDMSYARIFSSNRLRSRPHSRKCYQHLSKVSCQCSAAHTLMVAYCIQVCWCEAVYSSVSGFIIWFCCLETSVGYKAWAEENISEMVHGMLLSLIHYLSLASQTHFRKKREGSGELRIQAVSHRTVQCGPITLQYFVT